MKYVKFTQIDYITGISNNVETPKNGLMFPNVDGLEILFQDTINDVFWYGTVPDDTTSNVENQFFILSNEEFANKLNIMVIKSINERKDELYEEEKRVRDMMMGKYHVTASIAGLYKYDQAKEYLLDANVPATELRLEANVRGISVDDLALMVISLHDEFREKEALVAGIRGMLYDRLDSFVFDVLDPMTSWNEFHSTETIGEEEIPKYGTDILTRVISYQVQ